MTSASQIATVPRRPAGVLAAAWLADDVLVLFTEAAAAGAGYGAPPQATRFFDDPEGGVHVVALRVAAATPGGALEDELVDLQTALREHVASWPAQGRASFLEFLASLQDEHPSDSLAEGLYAAREALRERLPLSVLDPSATSILHVERLHKVDERGFYVQGWAFATDASAARLAAVSPEGSRAELGGRIFRYPRLDVAEFLGLDAARGRAEPLGFAAYFRIDALSRRRQGWLFERRNAGGRDVEGVAPPVEDDPRAVRETLLADLGLEPRRNEALREHHLRPALTKLQELRARSVRIELIEEYGIAPAEPETSIIVPLYGRLDLLEHQLAQFVDDAELRSQELLYVLDSPEMAEELGHFASQLFELYRLPFRVVTLSQNGGFSLANNLGASVARGRKLLLLNSDVIPATPGWLSRLLEFYDATPNVGALAPKLLYEDDAIQHAGLYFRRVPDADEWSNEHYYKGMHRHLPAANVARPVPAVTAACLLTDAALFERLGGLRGIYVQGDYEDSDYCLRVREEGLDCWYYPQVELYHLEGQSYPSVTRERTALYNRWLHSRLWGDAIPRAMAEWEGAQP